MNLRLIAAAAAGVVAAAVALVALVTWTPPAHPVRTSGATAVQAHLAPGWVRVRALVPAPTTSLDKVRCDAWQALLSPQPCPDAVALTKQMWPSLAQSPKTLYVPLSSYSVLSGSPEAINVEYLAAGRTLTIHIYASQALYVAASRAETAGAQLAPGILLLLVETDRLPTGEVTVWADSWIERLTGDEKTTEWKLGTVGI